MIGRKRIILCFLIMTMVLNLSSCGFKKETQKQKQINVYIDVKDKESLDIIKTVTEEFKKENPKIKLNINNSIGGKVDEEISKGSEEDIVITSRNNMLKLCKKGLLSDLASAYDENKIADKYYNVVKAFGRFGDKYYGIAITPFTLEMFYNKAALEKLNIKSPRTMQELRDTLKQLTAASKSIPVVINENIDMNSALSSLVINNKVNMRKLEDAYESNASKYNSLKEMQEAFDIIYGFISSGSINKNTFSIGNESSVDKFVKGDIPFIICTSYYAKNFDDSNIMVAGQDTNATAQRGNVPVICNALLCTPVNSKNGEEVGSFIKFFTGDDINKKLIKEGIITGNKKTNSKITTGVKSDIVKHLENSTEDSVMYIYNLSEKLNSNISAKIDQMLNGRHTGKEWEEIVRESFK